MFSSRVPLPLRPSAPRPSIPRALPTSEATPGNLLDSYWKLRGVVDAETRRTLVSLADEPPLPLPQGRELDLGGRDLPSITVAWTVAANTETQAVIQELSRRLLALQSLLGGEGERAIDSR
jgi:hypothetical protein